MKVEEKTFRFFKVSFYILAISVLFLVAIVLYFVGEKPKMCVEVPQETSYYDVNNDGTINVYDVIEETKKIEEIKARIVNEN
jgi:hypothetical protein